MKNEKLLQTVLEDLHKSTLAIPVLDGYHVIDGVSDAIMVAKSDDESVEQFLEDGKLNEGESFEQRLTKVIHETHNSMKENGLRKTNLKHLRDYESKLFHFHLYLQDNIKNNIQVRQVNAYFLEPEANVFYELSLAAPPLLLKDINDNVTENILERLLPLLKNVKYNTKNPLK